MYCENITNIYVSLDSKQYYTENNCLITTESKTLILISKNGTIPSDGSVTRIASYAFTNMRNIEELTIPERITEIYSFAFSDFENLKSLVLPASLTTVYSSAFSGTKYFNLFMLVTKDKLEKINFNGNGNFALYLYSEEYISEKNYKYWHYVDGVPTPW